MNRGDLQLVALGVLAWWLLRKRPDVGAAVVEDLVPAPRATVAALQPRPPTPARAPLAPSDLLPAPKIPDVLQATGDPLDASKGFAGGGGGQSGGAGAGGSV